jgi:hypothetical protein
MDRYVPVTKRLWPDEDLDICYIEWSGDWLKTCPGFGVTAVWVTAKWTAYITIEEAGGPTNWEL